MNPLDDAKLRYQGISIMEPWEDIISGFRAMGQILDKENNTSSTGDMENNAGAGVGDTSDIGDAGSTGGANNNFDN